MSSHGFVLASGPLIDVEHLPGWLVAQDKGLARVERLEDCERRVILSALERNEGNRVAAAEQSGIHKSTLYRRMRRLGLVSAGTDSSAAGGPRDT